MPRPSPQTDRVVAIVNHLATHPDGATSTEIARDLAIHASSCVHVLAALTTAGFLVRDPADRRYHLGPALVLPGRVAAQRYGDLAVARAEMARLSADHGRPCFAFEPDGDHARLVQYTWPPGTDAPGVRVGDTVPRTPPLGAVFAAWAAPDEVQRWLDLDASLSVSRRRRYEEQLDLIRRAGHVIEARPAVTTNPDLARLTDERRSPWRDGHLHRMLVDHGSGEHVVTDVDPGSSYLIHAIGAPVFDATDRVAFSLTLVFFDVTLTGSEILDIARDVQAAAGRASGVIRAAD